MPISLVKDEEREEKKESCVCVFCAIRKEGIEEDDGRYGWQNIEYIE